MTRLAYTRVALIALLLPASLVTGCLPGDEPAEPEPTPIGFPIGTPVVATIGAAGGTLASDDGSITLIVPAGALAADTELTLEPVMSFAHGAVGAAFRLGPEGTAFATPATVRFALDEAELVRSEVGGVGIAYQSADGLWHWTDATYDAVAHTLSTETSHLSAWSMVSGIQLVPGGALVPEGSSISIVAIPCYAPPTSDPSLAPLGYRCDEASGLAPLVQVDEWAVNGVAGGNATFGTITGSGQTATYQAPSTRPSPATVRVSARVRGDALGGTVYVFSHLTIGEPHPLAGQVTISETAFGTRFTVTLDVELPIADDGPDETNWSATGTATIEPLGFPMGEASCVIDSETQPIDEEHFLKIRKDPQLAIRFGNFTQWDATCTTPEGTTHPWTVIVSGQTGSGMGCTTFRDAPITDVEHIDETYTSSCGAFAPAEIHWVLNRAD